MKNLFNKIKREITDNDTIYLSLMLAIVFSIITCSNRLSSPWEIACYGVNLAVAGFHIGNASYQRLCKKYHTRENISKIWEEEFDKVTALSDAEQIKNQEF